MRIDLPEGSPNAPVSLFLLEPEHVTATYVSWLNANDINKYLESRFETHTVQSTAEFVAANLASADSLLLGITSRLLDRHVGNIKLGPIDHQHSTADIGLLIGDRSAWGKGIATSAITLVTDIARTQLHLRKLTAGCYASNEGSKRAFEKSGFVVEGVRPAQFLLDGLPEDLVLMGRILQ